MTITLEQAEEWLKNSLIIKYAPLVDKYDNIYHWNQNQFDALLSFTYNIGNIVLILCSHLVYGTL